MHVRQTRCAQRKEPFREGRCRLPGPPPCQNSWSTQHAAGRGRGSSGADRVAAALSLLTLEGRPQEGAAHSLAAGSCTALEPVPSAPPAGSWPRFLSHLPDFASFHRSVSVQNFHLNRLQCEAKQKALNFTSYMLLVACC